MDHDAIHEAAVVSVVTEDISRIKASVILSDGHEPSEELVCELQE
jgi:acyl-coenzyme A synthetase/AMP-(fatty) acid ligase